VVSFFLMGNLSSNYRDRALDEARLKRSKSTPFIFCYSLWLASVVRSWFWLRI
jgi:hypothetical protein